MVIRPIETPQLIMPTTPSVLVPNDIFNTQKTDYERPLLFLGEQPGLLDSINKYYPDIWDLYKKMKKLDWDENEFNFSPCLAEFKSCTRDSYEIMIRTLTWQWEADSVASRSISTLFAPFVTSSELWALYLRITDNECVTGDHEVLTPKGWKRIDEVTTTDKVAQWDYSTHSIRFVEPERIIVKEYTGKMFKFNGSNNNISQVTTPNHRMPVIYPYWTNENQPEFKTADTVKYHGGNGIPTAGYIQSGKPRMTPQERLYVAVQADGSLCSEAYTGEKTGKKHYRFGFNKQAKIDRLFYLCELAGWEVKEINLTTDRNMRSFYVYVPVEEYNASAKTFDWFDFDQIGYEWALDFLDEIKYWDGNIHDSGCTRYTSTNKACVDKVVTLAHLTGQRGHVTIVPARIDAKMPNGFSNTKEAYQVYICDKPYVTGNSVVKTEIDYSGNVYCLTVPTGYFITRHNNAVSITGNCLHALTYSEIVRASFENPNEVLKDVLAQQEPLQRLSIVSQIFHEASVAGRQYQDGIRPNDDSLYDVVFMLVVALFCLERIQFMASFAITFTFGNAGQFLQPAKAVQKICQDEYEVHAKTGEKVLLNELSTPRGIAAMRRLAPRIKRVIDEVVLSEYGWLEHLFMGGVELTGGNKEKYIATTNYFAAPVYQLFGFTPDFNVPKKIPIGFLADWINIGAFQPAPQEEKNGQYFLGGIVDTAANKTYDVDDL